MDLLFFLMKFECLHAKSGQAIPAMQWSAVVTFDYISCSLLLTINSSMYCGHRRSPPSTQYGVVLVVSRTVSP